MNGMKKLLILVYAAIIFAAGCSDIPVAECRIKVVNYVEHEDGTRIDLKVKCAGTKRGNISYKEWVNMDFSVDKPKVIEITSVTPGYEYKKSLKVEFQQKQKMLIECYITGLEINVRNERDEAAEQEYFNAGY